MSKRRHVALPIALLAATLALPTAASAITFPTGLFIDFDPTSPLFTPSGSLVSSGKAAFYSNPSGTNRRFKLLAKKLQSTPGTLLNTDGVPCSFDEPVCVASIRYWPPIPWGWIDVVFRREVLNGKLYIYEDICLVAPSLCGTGTIMAPLMVTCYPPDATSLPPPAFAVPFPSGCEGAYLRPWTSWVPSAPTTVPGFGG